LTLLETVCSRLKAGWPWRVQGDRLRAVACAVVSFVNREHKAGRLGDAGLEQGYDAAGTTKGMPLSNSLRLSLLALFVYPQTII